MYNGYNRVFDETTRSSGEFIYEKNTVVRVFRLIFDKLSYNDWLISSW